MLTDDLVEDRLRKHFAESLEQSGGLVAQVLRRQRKRNVRRAVSLTLPLAIVAVVLGLTLSAGAPPRGTPPSLVPSTVDGSSVMRLASYDFHLPRSYHPTSTAHTPCQAIVTIGGPHASGVTFLSPYSTATIASAVGSTDGCVSMLLTPPFTPSPTTPAPYLRSDPHATSSPVQVASDSGWLTTQATLTRWLETQGLVTPDAPLPDLQLSVEVPQGGGELRVLEVGSQGINEATLVRIVGRGLSS